MKRLFSYWKTYRLQAVLAPLFKCLEACFELFVPIVIARMIDRGINGADRGYVLRMALMLLLLAGIGLACSVTAQYFAAKVAIHTGTQLRNDLFRHITGLGYGEIDNIGTSTLITRMSSDTNQVQTGVNMFLRLFMRSPFIVFGAMIMAFTIDGPSALIFVVTIPLLALVVFSIMLYTMPLYQNVQKQLDRVTKSSRENLLGVRVVRAFNRQKDEKQSFREENDRLVAMQVFVGKISALLNPVTYVIINLSIVVLILVGGERVMIGRLTQGEVVALVNYMSQILVELIKLANLIILISKALACLNRVEGILAMQPSVVSPEDRDTFSGAAGTLDLSGTVDRGFSENVAEKAFGVSEALNLSGTMGRDLPENRTDRTSSGEGADQVQPLIRFSHVSFSYGGGAPSLKDVDFSVRSGETIGIIGGTGCGKSTLVNLIPRFYDATEGTVQVNGADVRRQPLDALRGLVGMVPQRAVLFQGSLRDNMKWGKADATDEEIYQALETAQAAEFVKQKQEGLDLYIEQGGRNLSGGQRQRLTIARALVRKPKILILDDAASALDFATDAALRKAIRENTEGMTVFVISQRATSVKHADQIVVLEDGEVAGIGTHEGLLKACPVYREICLSQLSKEEVMAHV